MYRPNRPDVIVHPGWFEDTLTPAVVRDIGPIGLLHVDCDLYGSTKTVLDRVGPLLQPGAVVVFDELYNYFGWEEHEVKAFLQFVVEQRIEVEYLGRTPTCQVSVRIAGRGRGPRARVRPCMWTPLGPGVGIRTAAAS